MKKKKSIKDKKYFFISIFYLLGVLFVISSINLNVDPENIYSKKLKFLTPQQKTSEIVSDLRFEKKFLVVGKKTWNDREFVNNLLDQTINEECLLLGSSQIRLISVELKPKALGKTCSSLINLGLNGSSIEDYLSIFNKIRLNNIKNKKIIITIHPWTLNFNRDSRWIFNEDDFNQFINFIRIKDNNSKNKTNDEKEIYFKIFKNLINLKYFSASIKKIIYGNKNLTTLKNKFELKEEDFKKEIIYYDGSIIKNKTPNTDFLKNKNRANYKIVKNVFYSKNVTEILEKSINEIDKTNNIIFLLTPYHPEVWKLKNEPIYQAMLETEKIINIIARKKQIEIIGSFNPKNLNCKKDEFHDLLHASKECLNKLENYSFNN